MVALQGKEEGKQSYYLLCVLLSVGVCSLLSAALLSTGWFFYSSDDYNRLGYAIKWAEFPFFAPGDHIWLSGSFVLLGILIKVLGDPMLAVLGWSVINWAMMGAAIAFFTRTYRLPDAAGIVSILLLPFLPALMPLILSPMPDLPHLALLIFSTSCFVRAWRGSASLVWFLGGSASLFLATTLRYESWLLVPFSQITFLVWLARNAKANNKSRPLLFFLLAALILLLPMLFPALWLTSSWYQTGDPLSFTHGTDQTMHRHLAWTGHLRLEPGSETTTGGRLRDVLYVLGLVPVHAGWLCLLIIPLLLLGGRRMLITLIPLIVWVLIVSTIVFRSGVPGNAPYRILLFIIATVFILLVSAAISLAAKASHRIRHAGWVVCCISLIAFCGHVHVSFKQTEWITGRGIDNGTIFAGLRLRHELNRWGDHLKYAGRSRVHIWTSPTRGGQGEMALLRALSGNLKRTIEHWSDGFPRNLLEDPEVHYLMVSEVPNDWLKDAGFRLLSTEGSWQFWARETHIDLKFWFTDAPIRGTEEEPTLFWPYLKMEWMVLAPEEAMSWKDAEAFATACDYAGGGWRLPTESELWQLTNRSGKNHPGMDSRLRPRASQYWSSDTHRPNTRRTVDFARVFSADTHETHLAHVRLIRPAE